MFPQDFSRELQEPFGFVVARSGLPGYSVIQRSGFNPSVGTGVLESLWPQSSLYVFPSAASTMTVSSTSANDAAAGTGARTVLLTGLDANYLPIQETLTMNGQTGVVTVNSYLRVQSLAVLTAGSGGENAGAIRVGTGAVVGGVPAVVYGMIDTGWNASQQMAWTVPAGVTAYLVDVSGSASAPTTNQNTVLSIRARPFGGIFLRGGSLVVVAGAFYLNAVIPRRFDEKTDIDAVALTTDNGVTVAAQLRFLLVSNQ